MDRFHTEEACRKYLVQIRWNSRFACPRCSSVSAWEYGDGTFRCTKCRRDTSVTAGTVFQGSHIPLRIWFQAIWSVVSQKHGVSALGLSRALGINRQKTGWSLLGKIRGAMVREGRERLKGVVEVDESLLGGVRPGKRGRGAFGKTLVLIAVEDKGDAGIGRIRIAVIPDASAKSLRDAVSRMVEPGSTVRTDEWVGYSNEAMRGYRHKILKRSSSEPGYDPTPLVHRVASLLKRWLLGTHQGGVKETHLTSYLEEFVFRFNRRSSHSRGKLFYRVIQEMVGANQA
ncbi:IS1595 family transposase [Patescibacteria group bacterium]|nr:IS1595 family transposase [Patescibacteria group bacterium]